MPQTIQVKRGLSTNLPASLAVGELAFTTDTQKFYVGTGTGRVEINGLTDLPDVGTPGTYAKVTTDAKGRIISGQTKLTTGDITGLGDAAVKDTGVSAGNIPLIGSTGKLPDSIIPAVAITDTFVVNSEAAMLALDAQVGDLAVRTDVSKTFILQTAGASVLSNWVELKTPQDNVTSVAGKTGAVTLDKNDVGLSNVNNTSDMDKPVSTAQQTALDLKANIASPTFTGAPKGPTAAVDTNTTQLATTAFVIAQASSTAPLGLAGSGVVGTSKKFARADHAHPMPSLIDGGTF